MRLFKICIASIVALAAAPPAKAEPAPGAATPDVATLLFDKPQWTKAPAGASLTYAYSQAVPVRFGPSFDDKIVLKLDKGDDDKSRTAEIKMFSGEHAKPAGPFRSDEQNPVMLLALEANVEQLAKTWDANPRYLKNAIRKAWRTSAEIKDVAVVVDGKPVPGTRITIVPFKGDPEATKMGGLETMTYTIEVADAVPGNLARIDIHAPATGKPEFAETLTYASETAP